MKKFVSLALGALLTLSTVGCGKDTNSAASSAGELTDIQVAEGYVPYELEECLPTVTQGFGAQIDTDVYMPWNELSTPEEEMLKQRIEDMNLQFTRIKFFPEYFERENDNGDPNVFDYDGAGVDFESREMQALYKVLDICEEYKINVDLSFYGCCRVFKSDEKDEDGAPKYQGSWLGWTTEEIGTAHWVVAPKMTEDFNGYAEYAENICATLKYLKEEKKYTCIWGISVIAEMFAVLENGLPKLSWDAYADCVKVIDARLKKEGIRGDYKFLGTSNSGHNLKYFPDEQEKTKDVFDILGTGNYNWEYKDASESIRNYYTDAVKTANDMGKEGFYVAEFCQGKHFLDAVNKTDIDDYTAGMYIASFLVEAVTGGATAFNHYILGDTWFNNSFLHTMGLWQWRTADWKAHPEYYFWGLICRYTDIGCKVYPIVSEDYDISLVAFHLPTGEWTYMIVNKGKEAKKVAIVNGRADRPERMDAYQITEESIPKDRAVVLPTAYTSVSTKEGVAYAEVSACSFTLLSNKK